MPRLKGPHLDKFSTIENAVRHGLGQDEVEWYRSAVLALKAANIPCLLAGSFSLHCWTGFWRPIKDLDLIILPKYRYLAIAALQAIGLVDIFDQEPYDQEWICRLRVPGTDPETRITIDLIWQFANKLKMADGQTNRMVDQGWFAKDDWMEFLGERVSVLAPAEQIATKLHVFRRERTDWPDIVNVIRGTNGQLDWSQLLELTYGHWQLLRIIVALHDFCATVEGRQRIPQHFRDTIARASDEALAPLEGGEGYLHYPLELWLAEIGGGCSRLAE